MSDDISIAKLERAVGQLEEVASALIRELSTWVRPDDHRPNLKLVAARTEELGGEDSRDDA